MCMLRTTILLREDLYNALVRLFGKRNISKGINEYLYEHLFKEKKKKSMFGSCKWLQNTDWKKTLRDHSEHNF